MFLINTSKKKKKLEKAAVKIDRKNWLAYLSRFTGGQFSYPNHLFCIKLRPTPTLEWMLSMVSHFVFPLRNNNLKQADNISK